GGDGFGRVDRNQRWVPFAIVRSERTNRRDVSFGNWHHGEHGMNLLRLNSLPNILQFHSLELHPGLRRKFKFLAQQINDMSLDRPPDDAKGSIFEISDILNRSE